MASDNRQRANDIFQAGIRAADPATAVQRALLGMVTVPDAGSLTLLAIGKAAPAMARAAQVSIGDCKTIIVSHDVDAAEFPGAQVFTASHPVPDQRSIAAAKAIENAVSALGACDHILALISGGASALVCAPVAGISLADKVAVNRLLLGAGLDISAMNLVRQNLSRIKGGGLLRMATPATVRALILSDVIGNDLRVVASGPTLAPIGTRSQAKAVLKDAGLWQEIPATVRDHLSLDDIENVPAPRSENHLIGSNEHSVAAMAAVAPGAVIHAAPLEGDVGGAAKIVADKGAGVHLFGGETTVRLTGQGLGGRNQELALRVAIEAEKNDWRDDWVFLSGGTDGRDGPTDAAGGLVDAGTLSRMRAAGINPGDCLGNNDSYHGLKASGDLLMTGATGTNVADLQVLMRP